MELSLRTVLVILGSLFILGIIVDGFRRMRRARQDALKIDVQGNFQFPAEGFSSELPNGGARVIEENTQDELLEEAHVFKEQLDDLPRISALDEIDNIKSEQDEIVYVEVPGFQDEAHVPEKAEEGLEGKVDRVADYEAAQNISSEQKKVDDEINLSEDFDISPSNAFDKAAPLNLDEHVPLLIDVEELGVELEPLPATSLNETVSEAINETINTKAAVEVDNATVVSRESLNISPLSKDKQKQSLLDSKINPNLNELDKAIVQDDEEEVISAQENDRNAVADSHEYVENMTTQGAYAPVKKPGPGAELLADREAPGLVLITHVVPKSEEGFCGEDILYLVNNCDLRHGEKGIFHRFEQPNGEGCIQFSMANSFNPGIFDPETLLHERIYGLSLFMSLPGPEKAMDAFEAMSEMASVVARNLGGDVHDETHSIMALQTIEHNRQQVRDFVRKQKIAAKK